MDHTAAADAWPGSHFSVVRPGHPTAGRSRLSRGSRGRPHIWTVDSEGGTPRQITNDAGDQMTPTWSRDGEWIYFSWSRTRRPRHLAHAGPDRVERARHARRRLRGARVGRWQDAVVHIQAADSPVLAQPLAGGAPRPGHRVRRRHGVFGHSGGHLLHAVFADAHADPDPLVRVLDPATGKDPRSGEAGEV